METIGLLELLVLIIVAGVGLYLVNAFIPMEARIKQLLNAVVLIFLVIVVLIWLFRMAGLDSTLSAA